MKKLYFRVILVVITIVLILIFGTGGIRNCVNVDEVYTSYFNMHENNDKVYQALYFSQTKGIFYSVYGKMDLDDSGSHIEGIHLKAINYRRTLPFTFRIGFKTKTLDSSLLFKQDSTTLRLNLPIDRLWQVEDTAYLRLQEPIPIDGLDQFYIRRSFTGLDYNEIQNDTCKRRIIDGKPIEAVGLNCIESELKIVQ